MCFIPLWKIHICSENTYIMLCLEVPFKFIINVFLMACEVTVIIFYFYLFNLEGYRGLEMLCYFSKII